MECAEYIGNIVYNISGCIAINYSKTSRICQLFGHGYQSYPAGDNLYCELERDDHKSIDFVKLMFRDIFFSYKNIKL